MRSREEQIVAAYFNSPLQDISELINFRSRESLSFSTISQHFMEAESLLPFSQYPSTGLQSDPDESSPYKLNLSL
jgi:hypothetical protein